MGQGPCLHAQDLHQDEEEMGISHLPIRTASSSGKTFYRDLLIFQTIIQS